MRARRSEGCWLDKAGMDVIAPPAADGPLLYLRKPKRARPGLANSELSLLLVARFRYLLLPVENGGYTCWGARWWNDITAGGRGIGGRMDAGVALATGWSRPGFRRPGRWARTWYRR